MCGKRQQGGPGIDRVCANAAHTGFWHESCIHLKTDLSRPALRRITIRVGGLPSGCGIANFGIYPMKTIPLCTGPPETLTSLANVVRCVRVRPLRADVPRTPLSEELLADSFHHGRDGQASPPAGQRQRALRGERVGQGVAVIATIAPSVNCPIEARWNLPARDVGGLRVVSLSALRSSGEARSTGRFQWARDAGQTSAPVSSRMAASPAQPFIKHTYWIRGNLGSAKLPFVFQGPVLSTQNGAGFRL